MPKGLCRPGDGVRGAGFRMMVKEEVITRTRWRGVADKSSRVHFSGQVESKNISVRVG